MFTRIDNCVGTVTTDYPNGGRSVIVDGYVMYVKYNTGDQIWLRYDNHGGKVTKIHTHDGIVKEEGEFIDHPYGESKSS